jgi:hypothetical protein
MIAESLVRKGNYNIIEFVGEGAGHKSNAIKVKDYGVSFGTDMVRQLRSLGTREKVGVIDVV